MAMANESDQRIMIHIKHKTQNTQDTQAQFLSPTTHTLAIILRFIVIHGR
jgi:hypothetical protein